ncbi:MAG: proline--tRNA ligase [Verrucomicrobiota bacterium]|nr:proline--tRNA ligase [Verrucomicrobiota bacterium]
MANQPPAVKTAITPRREDDFPEWYQQVIRAAELAEPSDVRGCMVIRPWGYAIWENMQRHLDAMFKATGHKNAYFPLFIPLSYFEKEAAHVEGFAKECAVVTHSRLEVNAAGKMVPASPLGEPLVVRPTSETIIGATYAKWVQSYRDLPILINQWANVVRWEMRPRVFLRTTEFLWQEGHTVHESEGEAREETKRMLYVYETFVRDYLAIPVFSGEKSESERFPGAVQTLCIEAMVQDRKAIQAGTSHFLGQNFAKASGIRFQTRDGKQEFGWTTSWGMSTRMVGTLIMAHADDDGLILPPRIAQTHVVIIPITPKEESRAAVLEAADKLAAAVRETRYADAPIEVEIDRRDLGGGIKNWEWIKKGVPVRVEIGPRDLESGNIAVSRRDQAQTKEFVPATDFPGRAAGLLDAIQQNLLQRAQQFRDENTRVIDSREEFYEFFTPKNSAKPEIHGGFALAHWSGSRKIEEQIKNDLKVTIRCIPISGGTLGPPGVCIFSGMPSVQRVIWAKSY